MKIFSKVKKVNLIMAKLPKLSFIFLILFTSINVIPFLLESNSKKVEAQVPAGPGQWSVLNGTVSNENRNTSVITPVTTAGESWRKTAGRFLYAPFIASDGTIYDTDGAVLYAYNKNDGSVLWTKVLDGADNPYDPLCKPNILLGGSVSGYQIDGITSNGDIIVAGLDNGGGGTNGGFVFMRVRPTGANNPSVIASYKSGSSYFPLDANTGGCAVGTGGSFFTYILSGMSVDGNRVFIQQYLKGAILEVNLTPGQFNKKYVWDSYICGNNTIDISDFQYNNSDSTAIEAFDSAGSMYFSYGPDYFKTSFQGCPAENAGNANYISWYHKFYASNSNPDCNRSVMVSYEPTLGREMTFFSGGPCAFSAGLVLGLKDHHFYREDVNFNAFALKAADRTRNLLFGAAVGNPGSIARFNMNANQPCSIPIGSPEIPQCYSTASTGIWGSFTNMALGANMMYITSLNAAKTGSRLEARDVNNFTVNTFTMDFPANNYGQSAIANDGSVYISTGSILVKLGPGGYGTSPRATVRLSGNVPGGNRTVFAGDQNTFIGNITDADSNLGISYTGDPAGVKRAGMIWVATPTPLSAATSVFTETNTGYVTYNSLPFASTTAYTGSFGNITGPYTATNCKAGGGPTTNLGNCQFNVNLTFNDPGTYVVGINAYDNAGIFPNTNKCSGNYPFAGYGITSGPPWKFVRCDPATDKDYVVVTVLPKGWLSTSGSLAHSGSRFQGSVSNNSNDRAFAQEPIMYESFNGLSGAQTSITDDYNAYPAATANGSVVASSTTGNFITGSAVKFTPALNGASNLIYPVAPNFGANYNGSFTYSFWAKPTAAVTNGGVTDAVGTYFIDRGSSTSPLVDVKVTNSKYTFQYRYDDGTGLTDLTSAGAQAAVNVNSWAYVVVERDTSLNQFKLYVNGVLAASAGDIAAASYNVAAKTLTPPAPKLGGHNVNCLAAITAGCFTGYMDDFKVYNHALSDSQVSYEYSRLNGVGGTGPTVKYFNDASTSSSTAATVSFVSPLYNTNDSNGIYGITSYGNMTQKYADSNANLPVISNTTLSQLGPQYVQNINMTSLPSWMTGSAVAGYQIPSLAAVPDSLGNGAKSGIIYVIDLSAASNKNLIITYNLDSTALKTKKGLMLYVMNATLVTLNTLNTASVPTMSSNSSFMLLANSDISVQNAQGVNLFNAGLVSDGNIIYNCSSYNVTNDTTGCIASQNGFSFARAKVLLGQAPAQYKNTPDLGSNQDSLYKPTLNITYSANYIPDFRKLFSYTNYYSSTVGFDY